MRQILLVLAPEKRMLNPAALDRISSIFADAAQISLGTAVVPALLDKTDPVLIIWGLVITILFWLASIFVAQKIK